MFLRCFLLISNTVQYISFFSRSFINVFWHTRIIWMNHSFHRNILSKHTKTIKSSMERSKKNSAFMYHQKFFWQCRLQFEIIYHRSLLLVMIPMGNMAARGRLDETWHDMCNDRVKFTWYNVTRVSVTFLIHNFVRFDDRNIWFANS